MCKNNAFLISEIESKIENLRKEPNKRNIGIVNKLTVIKAKKQLTDKDLAFLETIEIYS